MTRLFLIFSLLGLAVTFFDRVKRAFPLNTVSVGDDAHLVELGDRYVGFRAILHSSHVTSVVLSEVDALVLVVSMTGLVGGDGYLVEWLLPRITSAGQVRGILQNAVIYLKFVLPDHQALDHARPSFALGGRVLRR